VHDRSLRIVENAYQIKAYGFYKP